MPALGQERAGNSVSVAVVDVRLSHPTANRPAYVPAVPFADGGLG